jgi:TetR/AcrR family transcriptional regulator
MKINKSANTKKKILMAAEKEFSEKGLYGARVDEIAHVAEVNKRMIYEHFGSKESLYKTVLLDVYKRGREIEEKSLTADKDCIQSIRDIIAEYFEFLQSNPTFVNMIMWENLNKAQYLQKEDAEHIKDPLINAIKRIIEEGKQNGICRADVDEEQVVLSLITFSFSYFSNIHTLSILLNNDMSSKESINKRVEHITNLILKYILI